MVEVLTTLLIASAIIFFGFFAEFLFSKLKIPDVLLLVLFGIVLGPYGFKYVMPDSLAAIAPIFTTFALLFLLFDGAFNIDIVSFAKGLGKGMVITIYNFFIASIASSLVLGISVRAKTDNSVSFTIR